MRAAAGTTRTTAWATRATTGAATSVAISDTLHVASAAMIRSRIRHSGSRTLHLANWPHWSFWCEQAVTVNGQL
jgi:hypothetical protein